MKNTLAFDIPFSGFFGMSFINCFTSTYMFLERIPVAGAGDEYPCEVRDKGLVCNQCGNCQATRFAYQERYLFLFDAMCGRSSLRCRFDGERTEVEKRICEFDLYDCGAEENIDFLFGFAGWGYRKITEPGEFKAAIIASIDAGKPVIGKVKAGDSRFRVITGYDDDALIEPDYENAQNRPERVTEYGELEALYVVTEKIAPRYLLKDGLRRILDVMEYNARENLWGGYTEKMGLYTKDSFGRIGIEEKKARMKRVAETIWHTFNCHNFAELFRKFRDGNADCYDGIGDMKRLKNPAFTAHFQRIGAPFYGYTHDLAWALIGLEECADWTTHASGYFGEMVELTLGKIAENDEGVLSAIRDIYESLEASE